MGALILLGYIAATLFGWWYMTPVVARSLAVSEDDLDLEPRLAGSFFAFSAALFWPVVLPILFMALHPRRTSADERAQMEAQARRIADLERELRIW
jgi:hypothetical protein